MIVDSFDLDNFIKENVLKCSLYKKQKCKFLSIFLLLILLSSYLIFAFLIEIESIEKIFYPYIFYIYLFFIILFILSLILLIISFYFENTILELRFLKKYDKKLPYLKSLVKLEKENHPIHFFNRKISTLGSIFFTLIITHLFSDFSSELIAGYFALFLIVFGLYVISSSLVDFFFLLFNCSTLKYDTLLRIIYTYELVIPTSKKNIFIQFLDNIHSKLHM